MPEPTQPWKKPARPVVEGAQKKYRDGEEPIIMDESISVQEPEPTGDAERDAKITAHREELRALKKRIADVRAMEDTDPSKEGAIVSVQEEIRRVKEASQMNPEWWTDSELDLWRAQAAAIQESEAKL